MMVLTDKFDPAKIGLVAVVKNVAMMAAYLVFRYPLKQT